MTGSFPNLLKGFGNKNRIFIPNQAIKGTSILGKILTRSGYRIHSPATSAKNIAGIEKYHQRSPHQTETPHLAILESMPVEFRSPVRPA